MALMFAHNKARPRPPIFKFRTRSKDLLGGGEVDIVRTNLFGSNAVNYDQQDEHLVDSRSDFFDILKEEYHYEVDIYPVDYRGRRLREKDRDKNDDFSPVEKCVDIALASSMLYFAAIPYAYDIAVLVAGDRDYIPVLRQVRRLGKRIAIASIKKSCPREFKDPKDEARLKDFDIIWIDDILNRIELRVERKQMECQSASHKGSKTVWTTDFIRKGKKFYCEACRNAFNENRKQQQKTVNDELIPETDISLDLSKVDGHIKKLFPDKTGGYIKGNDGD